jgi:Tfp pilus assembly protein PilO
VHHEAQGLGGLTMKKVLREYATTLGLIWVACFIVLIFVYVLVLKPQGQIKQTLLKQLEVKKQDYIAARATSNDESRSLLVADVEQMQGRLRRFVTDSDGSANLTFAISRIANENKVAAFSIKARDNKSLFEIPQCSVIGENRMDVSFVGDFRQFAMFLNALERHEPVIFVDSFSITKDNRDDEANKVSMSLSVFVEKNQSS